MAVLSLMVLFFVPQNAQAATVKRPSQVTKLSVKLTAKNTAKITWKKAENAKRYMLLSMEVATRNLQQRNQLHLHIKS